MTIMENQARILIVEDEVAMRMGLEDCLSHAGYRVLSATNGETGLQRSVKEKPDLILLDIMLPKMDGLTLCATLRKREISSAILMLTAKGQWEDRVRGLDLGADDYLVKPFQSEELLARVRALLRRRSRRESLSQQIRLGDVLIDFARQTAVRRDTALHLTTKEFAMLRLMVEAGGAPISRERFLDVVWGYGAFPTTRTVDNHIASLRQKLESNPADPLWILTVHGVGYRLRSGPETL